LHVRGLPDKRQPDWNKDLADHDQELRYARE
jgi:hypothetical protein